MSGEEQRVLPTNFHELSPINFPCAHRTRKRINPAEGDEVMYLCDKQSTYSKFFIRVYSCRFVGGNLDEHLFLTFGR
jgi:hypothetical protein